MWKTNGPPDFSDGPFVSDNRSRAGCPCHDYFVANFALIASTTP
jgi:hypothetical protein